MATVTPTSNLNDSLGSNPGINRLYDSVQMEVPAVQLEVVKVTAWRTIEEFYQRSTWRREHLFWEMGSGVQTIDFNPFDATWLVSYILGVSGLGSNAKIEFPSVLRDLTFPVPTVQRSGEVLLALRPVSFDATGCGSQIDDLWATWFETILSGTLAKLYMMPAKPWSSPQLAQFHGRKFMRGVGEARAIAQAQYGGGGGRWQFPYFAGGRRKS